MLLTFFLLSELFYLILLAKSWGGKLINLHDNQTMVFVVTILALLFIIYHLAYHKLDWKKQSVKAIFLIIAVFHLTFLFTPFLTSNDLYSYIFTTRIWPIFGQNPYFVPYNNFHQDPLFENLKTVWASHTNLYAPLFLYPGGLLNLIDQNNFNFLVWSFKTLFIAANLTNVILIYKITRSLKALLLFGTNPLIVFELSGNSHTESFTILFLLTSIYFLHHKPIVGFTSFVSSVLVKYYSALFLPFYFIKLARQGVGKLLLSLLVGTLLTLLTFWPFWRGPENFDYLLSYYNGQYTSPSLLVYLGEVILSSYTLSFQINTIIFLVIFGILIYFFWRAKDSLRYFLFYSFLLYWGYLLTKSSLILSWYLTPLVVLASLCIVWKKHQNYAYAGISFVTLYSLGLYYLVR